VRHVVWDWNGTLFDDFDANVAAVAEVCGSAGGPVVTADVYRRHFVRPVTVFYERLLGRPLEPGEWDRLNEGYFAAYRRRLASLRLVAGADEALAAVAASGMSQSLLSMWEHDELLRLVRGFGIDRHFVRVDGQRGTGGDTKEAFLARHVAHVEALVGPLDADEVLVVGDSVDDARAAGALGLQCLLVAGGPEHPEALQATGVAVVPTLADAVGAATERR
jgi:phosphoglycolate phosphatase-like HAD superfamily hydrolase